MNLPRSNALRSRIILGDGAKNLRRLELSERARALDQGNLGPPHPREVKLCLGDSAGGLEHDCILAVAVDSATESQAQQSN